MGNLFSGETEDFLLYAAIPLFTLAILVALAFFETSLRARFRANSASWLGASVARDERIVHYRSPASTQPTPEAPRSVRWLSRSVGVWGISVCALWVLVGICLVGIVNTKLSLLLPVIGIITLIPVARTPLALSDRNASDNPKRLQDARLSILVHHAVLALLATGFLGLFTLSNQFFWNGADDNRMQQFIDVLIAYGALIIPTSIVGFGLAAWLKSAKALYPATSKESPQAAT